MSIVALRAPMPGPLDEAWGEYQRVVLAEDATVAERCRARWAFYAGAAAFYRAAVQPLFPTDDVKPGDLRVLRELDAEIEQFSYDIAHGLARSRPTDFFVSFRAAVYGSRDDRIAP